MHNRQVKKNLLHVNQMSGNRTSNNMDYYRLLQLEREPFSNSPDPELFFKSRQHQKCLQALEISLRLKRGLNVVCGDVGTGKTTICRRLVRIFRNDDHIKTHLILDPTFENASVFLKTVGSMLFNSLNRIILRHNFFKLIYLPLPRFS